MKPLRNWIFLIQFIAAKIVGEINTYLDRLRNTAESVQKALSNK